MRVLGIDPGLRELGWAVVDFEEIDENKKRDKKENKEKNKKKKRKEKGERNKGQVVIKIGSRKYFFRIVSYGVISTDGGDQLTARLSSLGKELSSVFSRWSPDFCGIESVFVWKDPSAALKLGMVVGICVEVARRRKVISQIISPLFARSKILGDKHAGKEVVGNFFKKLGMKADVSHHITDAVAIAISYASSLTKDNSS